MKIAMICAHLIPELGWREHSLARGLSGLGHKVFVLTSDRKPWRHFYGDKRRVMQETTLTYKVRRIFTPFEIGESPIMSPRLFYELAQIDFDILDIHELYHSYAFFGFITSVMKRKPYVISSERTGPPSGWAKGALYTTILEMGKIVLKRAKHIIAASQGVRKYFISLGISENRITVIPNGVDTNLFQPKKSNFREKLSIGKAPLILYVGGLRHGKGIEDLIKAMYYVRKDMPDSYLVCVGDGPLKGYLLDLVNKLKLNVNIIFYGWSPHYKLPYIYSSSDVFVCPMYAARAAGPLVILEAMACGKPIVGTAIAQIPEFVIDGENGFITRPHDVYGLSRAIVRLLKNDELRLLMGKKNRERVEQMYSWQIISKRIEHLYENIINQIR